MSICIGLVLPGPPSQPAPPSTRFTPPKKTGRRWRFLPPVRTVMSKMPEITPETMQELNKQIVSTLRGVYMDRIAFSLGSYRITGQMLRTVADHIESGKILVIYNPKLKGKAEYNSVYDVLMVGFTELKTTKAGLLIHECVHAAMDAYGWNVNVTTSEALAYIAQALYLQMAFATELDGKPYHVAANSIATTIAYRGTPSAEQVTALRDALVNDKEYRDSLYTKAQYNGIHGLWRVVGGQMIDLARQYYPDLVPAA